MLLHERFGVLTMLLTAFGRAVAEVGAVMIVGGNIDGVTRVMTTAIALETSKGDLPLALALGVVLLAVVALVNLVIGLLQRRSGAPAQREAFGMSGTGRTRRTAAQPARCVGALRRRAGAARRRPDTAARRPAGAGRRQRLGQDDAAAAAARPGAAATAGASCTPGAGRGAPVVAMLFQRPFLLQPVGALRTCCWGCGCAACRGRAPRRAAQQALQRVGLAGLAGRPARDLSGGQQQRLALARAWALQPDMLFLDEPTASLDPGAKREVEALIDETRRRRRDRRDEHPQPGPGQAPGHARGLPRSRPAGGRPAGATSFFNDDAAEPGRAIPQGRTAMDTESHHPPPRRCSAPCSLAALAWHRRRWRRSRFIVMASTTSTEQSGLFKHLLPAFKQATGIDVRVVAVGTGQALDTGRRGDADVVFVHDTVAEEKFVAEGFCAQAPRR